MGTITVSQDVLTRHCSDYRSALEGKPLTFSDSDLKTFLDFPHGIVLKGIERFPLPDGKYYFRQDLQTYNAPGESGFEGQLAEDHEIPPDIYKRFRDSFEWHAAGVDGVYRPATYTKTIDDGKNIWTYMPELVSLASEHFIRQRKVSKETMQSYVNPYLDGLEALVGQQVSRESIQPPWEMERPRVFGTPAEYSLRFYDEGERNGKRTTIIVLSLGTHFDEGPVAKIHYTPSQVPSKISRQLNPTQ